jgi:hypothetical protein
MYAFCQDMPGVTLEDQAKLNELIPDEALTDCIAHVVGPIEGGVRMVDVWTDEAAYRQFQTQVLWPALDRLMATTDPAQAPAPEVFTVLDVSGAGRHAGASVA